MLSACHIVSSCVFAGGLLCCTHCPNAHSTRLAQITPLALAAAACAVLQAVQCLERPPAILAVCDAAGLLLAAVVVYRLSSVEAYDPREGRWSELTSMQVRL